MGFTKEQIEINQEIEIVLAISDYDVLIDNRVVNIATIYNVAFQATWRHIFKCWRAEYDIWQEPSRDSLAISDYEKMDIFTKYDRTQINYPSSEFLGDSELFG